MFYKLLAIVLCSLILATPAASQPTPTPTPFVPPPASPTASKKAAANSLEATLNEKLLEKQITNQKKKAAKIAERLAAAQKKAAARKKVAHAAIDDLRTQLTNKELSVSELEKRRIALRDKQELIKLESPPPDSPAVRELIRQRDLLVEKIRKNNRAFHCKVLHIGCISEPTELRKD